MTSKLISIRLPEWLANELDIEAAEEGKTRTEFIKRLYLEHKTRQLEINDYLSQMAAEAAEKELTNGN